MQTHKMLDFALLGAVLLASGCKRETKDEMFHRTFEQLTQKECPKYVDPCTRLDSASYDIPSRTVSYNYTVDGLLDNDSIYTDEHVDAFREEILKGLKNSIQMKPYKDESVSFRYIYYSMKTGRLLLKLSYSPDDYR